MTIAIRNIASVKDVKLILQKHKVKETNIIMKEIINLPRKRVKAPPPPKGGISINAAGKKYRIPPSTILKWVNKGIVPVVKKTINSTYIDENAVIQLSNLDRTIRHIFVENYNNDHNSL